MKSEVKGTATSKRLGNTALNITIVVKLQKGAGVVGGVDWINLAHAGDKWRVPVNTVTNCQCL